MSAFDEVNIRELRNNGGRVLDRVARGETLSVTRDGTPVAELTPVRRRSLSADQLIRAAKRLPKVDPDRLRADVDTVVDQSW
ncbi:type II toxin-antitoxin system Phd/YefM family antitoxin [Tsukamurella soli]|uniref:Antitoxin n=1 Tax=Tsukamurella soli TaxID=644556 RepID=A0ABP8J5T0_9ACTN